MPENQRAYGIVSVGAALGDDDYVQMYLREKGDELCAEGDGIIDRIATGLANKSEQAANVASVLSLQERINYLLALTCPARQWNYDKWWMRHYEGQMNTSWGQTS